MKGEKQQTPPPDIPSMFFFSSALSGALARDFTQQKTNRDTAAFFMRQQPHEEPMGELTYLHLFRDLY